MPGPHPQSLRDRVIEAYNDGEGTYRELAARFKVGEASVNRWVALDRWCGDSSPKRMGGARRARCIIPAGEAFLQELLCAQLKLI